MKLQVFLLLISVLSQSILAQDDPEMTTPTSTSTSTSTETTTSTTTPTTTTPTTTTTTTTTPSTTTSPSTTTEVPKKPDFYSVTENNVTCIMVSGSFVFGITYRIKGDPETTNTTMLQIPKPSSDSRVEGTCNSTEEGYEGTQSIKIFWNKKNFLAMTFNASSDKKTWTVIEVTSEIYMDKDNFVNGTDQGKILKTTAVLPYSEFEIAVNGSFKCFSKFEVGNISTVMEKDNYSYPLTMTLGEIKMEAYNEIPFQNSFGLVLQCEADKIADIVPIGVGLALGALIVIVLIAYIVGRRRRTAPYQSV